MEKDKFVGYLRKIQKDFKRMLLWERSIKMLFPNGCGLDMSCGYSLDIAVDLLEEELDTDLISLWVYKMDCGLEGDCTVTTSDGIRKEVRTAEELWELIQLSKEEKYTKKNFLSENI